MKVKSGDSIAQKTFEREINQKNFEKELKEKSTVRKQDRSGEVFKPPIAPKTALGKKLLNKEDEILDPQNYLKNPLKESVISDLLFPELESKILVVDRVCHTLEAGKIYRFRVTAAVGNKKGVIGLGVGKHKFKDKAIVKAIDQAKKNMFYLASDETDLEFTEASDTSDLTSAKKIYYGPDKVTQTKLSGTVLEVSPLLNDSITASKWGQEYCKVAGFTRIKICLKRKSSVASKMNYYKALHEALKKQITTTTI